MIAPQTALDAEREDEVSSLVEVAQIDAAIASVEAELTAARATLRAQAREAARALIADKTPTSGVRDTLTRIDELAAMLAGLAELRIIAQYSALESLAADADKTAEGLLSEAEALDARFWAIRKGEVDLGPEAERSDIPRMDALDGAENAREGALRRRTMLVQEASQLRDQRAKLKRAHANLFAAEGIA